MIVYAFELCYCRYESGWTVNSLHATKRLAAKAMFTWLFQDVLINQQMRRLNGRSGGLDWRGEKLWNVPSVDGWRVKAYEVQTESNPAPVG